MFGDLTGRTPVSPQAAALDLVRSYAHDCLHYATFRRYRLTGRGEIARVPAPEPACQAPFGRSHPVFFTSA